MQLKTNKINSSKIKSFSVFGLFGTNNVHIPFDEDIKILIGENGLGKTQLLSIFYYTLTRNFIQLGEFPFDEVELNIGINTIRLSKKEINEYIENIYGHPLSQEIISLIGVFQFELLRKEIRLHGSDAINFMASHPIYRRLRGIRPLESIIRQILKMETSKKEKKISSNILNILECYEDINKFLSDDMILYFPTFRRVEVDSYNLGYLGYDYDHKEKIREDDDRLIRFGMTDVQIRFNTIEKK